MSTVRPQPLFVDTGGFVGWFDEDDEHHSAASAVIEGIQADELPHHPVFTSRYVLAELATLLLYNVGHSEAVAALADVRESETFNILPVGPATFADACDEFERYDDQGISMVDHLSSVLARENDIDHIFGFDSDFATLGFTRVPDDTDGR